MSASIGRRLAILVAIPIATIVMLSSAADYYVNIAEQLERGEQRLNLALNQLTQHVQTGDLRQLDATTNAPLAQSIVSDSVRYAIRNEQQQLVNGDPTLPIINVNRSTKRLRNLMTVDHVYMQLLTQRLEGKDSLTVTVAKTVDTSWSWVRFGLTGKLLSDFILLDLVLVLAWIGVKIGLRPLRDLRDQIAGRSPQDLRPIPESSAPQELAPLISTLNRLFSVVEGSINTQKQLVASTAHQLRTPITGINAQLELLLADPAADAIKDRLSAVHEGAQQLTRSINQLLALARADAASTAMAHNKSINMLNMISEITARFVDRAVAANIDLGVETQPICIKADKALLDDLLSNLIDNALKYTKPGGTVTVSNGIVAGQPYLQVDDSGIGIPQSEYQRIRQRYYRSPNSPGHGTGLGLAIVEEIARFYGGTLIFEVGQTGRGTKVRVQFPEWMECSAES